MSRTVINDMSTEWRERRESVKTQGYEILFEMPRDWSVKQAEAFVRRGFAVPVIRGKAYVAMPNAAYTDCEKRGNAKRKGGC